MKTSKEPKYGLIVFKNTDNIGDDIQSYAQSQFLPHIDYVIDREQIDSFVPNDNEIVNCIMNAWWLNKRTNWPPSPYINPLPVSMHMRNTEEDSPTYLDGMGMQWFKKHEPIGLRDDLVKKYLDAAGVKNYHSGCMTLTIKKDPKLKRKSYICVNDIDETLLEKLQQSTDLEIKIMKHDVDAEESKKLTWEERKERVKKLLDTYQQAACVITSRLHCTLPCLALEVPVLLIYDDENQDVINRMHLFLDCCNHISKKESIENFEKIKDYIANPPQNPEKYKEFRKSLTDKCQRFIKNAKTGKISDEEYQKFKKNHMNDIKRQAEELYFDKEELQYQRNYYRKQAYAVDGLERRIKKLEGKLNSIYQSKRWRYIEKLRTILGMNRKKKSNED